jgi:hypothetical protein
MHSPSTEEKDDSITLKFFGRETPHSSSQGWDNVGFFLWLSERVYSKHYATWFEMFRRGWEGRMSGGDWATMYALGFAEKMPKGMVYGGPPRVTRSE